MLNERIQSWTQTTRDGIGKRMERNAEHVLDTIHLLSEILRAPDPLILETFLGKIVKVECNKVNLFLEAPHRTSAVSTRHYLLWSSARERLCFRPMGTRNILQWQKGLEETHWELVIKSKMQENCLSPLMMQREDALCKLVVSNTKLDSAKKKKKKRLCSTSYHT